MGSFGIEISPPEAYFLFLRRCRPPKSHPLTPISYFCGVFWPPNLTPNHLITLMYLFYIPIPFFATGIVFAISAALSILPYTSFSKTIHQLFNTHICYFCCPAAPTHQLFKCPHLPSYLKKVISGSCCACLKTLTP